MGGTSSTTRPKTDQRWTGEQLCCNACSHHNPGQLCRPTLCRRGTSTTAMSPPSGEEPKWPTSECRTPSTRTNGWFTSTTSSAALPPADHAPPAANPSGPSRATNSPGTSPTLSPPKPPAPPNRPSTWRRKRWSHRASTKPGTATAPTQYGYAVNADTRQARCPSKVNTSSPKPNGNRRATRAATS